MKKILTLIAVIPFFFSKVMATIIIDQIEYEIIWGTGNGGSNVKVKKVPTNYNGGIAFSETIEFSGNIYTLTEIGAGACQNCKNLTEIRLPETIQKIGDLAFYGCENLYKCDLPENLEEIGFLAFANCKIMEVEFPRSLTILCSDAYQRCPIKNVFIPNTLSFKDAPTYQEYINNQVLREHYNSVIPSSSSPLIGCLELETIVIEEGHPVYDSRDDCNAIIRTATNELIKGCCNTTIPDGIVEIGRSAFGSCKKLTEISLPSSIKIIKSGAFKSCENLEKIHLNQGLAEIEASAFYDCKNLRSIYIPSSITKIGNYVLQYCSNLESITVEEGNPIYDSREGSNALIKTSDNLLLWGCKNTIIPTSINGIGGYAFQNCTDLTAIDLPNVRTIGGYAFEGCTGLTSVVFGDSLKAIGNYAFKGCTSITTLTIPEKTKIGSWAFHECSNLKTLYLHIKEASFNDGNVKINSCAFHSSKTNNLTTIYCFSERPFNIDETAFGGGYKRSNVTLYVPLGSSDLYKNSSIWKTALSAGWVNATIEEFDVTIKKYKLTFIVGGKEYKTIEADYGTAITPDMLPTKEGYIFQTYLIPDQTYLIPETMPAKDVIVTGFFVKRHNTFEKEGAGYEMKEDKTVTLTKLEKGSDTYEIPASVVIDGQEYRVTAVAEGAFKDNTNLKELGIPESILSIGVNALAGCVNLEKIHLYSDEPISIGQTDASSVFSGVDTENCILYVPAGTADAYRQAEGWKAFKNIVEMEYSDDINVDNGGRWNKYIVTSGTVGVATHEDYPNLFDNDTNTKWCVTDVSNTIYVEFDATQSIKPIGYVLTTAVDTYPACLDRNPKSWVIKGRNSTNGKWTTIATIADGLMPTGNSASKTFTLDTDNAYRYYRFEVTTLVGGDIFQLSEFCFLVDDINSETSDEDPDDINDINVDDGTSKIYMLDGKPIETLQKGVNIIKYMNGKVKKVVVK